MSSYGMCPYVLCMLHSTRFWYKRRGFAVMNIDIISYLVVKNLILCNHRNVFIAFEAVWFVGMSSMVNVRI